MRLPKSPFSASFAQTYQAERDYTNAILFYRKALELEPHHSGREKVGQPSRLPGSGETPDLLSGDDTARTATVERVPDPRGAEIDAIWDAEWRANLRRAALDRIKSRVNPAHYEMYHLHVVQGLSPRDTARALGVSTASVYLAKHRVGRLVKAELKRLSPAKSQR